MAADSARATLRGQTPSPARGHRQRSLPSRCLESQVPCKLLTLSNWKLMALAREAVVSWGVDRSVAGKSSPRAEA